MTPNAWRALEGVRVVEAATYIAAPLAGMSLRQMGAEVIRVDVPSGAIDRDRWPLAPSGQSLYWANFNKGKKSVLIDYRSSAGRDLLLALATAPGPGAGIFVDNMVGRARVRYEELRDRRVDVIHAHVLGRPDGGTALDYMANSAVGIPFMTGPEASAAPVNHVLPAWDILTGLTLATGILGALHHRSIGGGGAKLDLALTDVALSAVGNLGWLAAADIEGTSRPAYGNYVYGAFGLDFSTVDGKRVMVIGMTASQWTALTRATGTTEVFTALETAMAVDLTTDQARFELRHTIAGILRPWFESHTYVEVSKHLEDGRVLWGPYHDMVEASRLARFDSDLAADVDHPGIGPSLSTASPLRVGGTVGPPEAAPALGADTDEILSTVLGLSSHELGRLHDHGVVASSTDPQPSK